MVVQRLTKKPVSCARTTEQEETVTEMEPSMSPLCRTRTYRQGFAVGADSAEASAPTPLDRSDGPTESSLPGKAQGPPGSQSMSDTDPEDSDPESSEEGDFSETDSEDEGSIGPEEGQDSTPVA